MRAARSPCPVAGQPPSVRELLGPVLPACREALGDSGFDAAWSQGQGLALSEAVGYVTRGRGSRARPALGWESLTLTELTVAGAVAEGLSNPQIAARMFISRRTVTTHLTSIFRKLSLSSRAELAALAARREDHRPPPLGDFRDHGSKRATNAPNDP